MEAVRGQELALRWRCIMWGVGPSHGTTPPPRGELAEALGPRALFPRHLPAERVCPPRAPSLSSHPLPFLAGRTSAQANCCHRQRTAIQRSKSGREETPGWEGQFLSRLIGSPGVPKERGLWNPLMKRKGPTFSPLHSLGLNNNNVSCLRTVSGKDLLADSVILKFKLWEWV